MSPAIHLAVDGMGGDFGPRLALSASCLFIQRYPQVCVLLFGDTVAFNQLLPNPPSGLIYMSASQVVDMDEKPAFALRHKQDSSMWRAIAAVASGSAHACLSGGNTGALMAISRHLLGTQPQLERPAICKAIPTAKGECWMLDLGANLQASPGMLLEFARLGAQLAERQLRRRAKVALLNVGSEAGKGLETIRLAAALLADEGGFDYCGFIEPSHLFEGSVDVVVCDGFVGNIALKSSEGAARFLFSQLRELIHANIVSRLLGILIKPLLRKLYQRLNPTNLNGALLLGLKGVVVKSHGGADVDGYCAALEVALMQAKQHLAIV